LAKREFAWFHLLLDKTDTDGYTGDRIFNTDQQEMFSCKFLGTWWSGELATNKMVAMGVRSLLV
jgi:hypothetical protein